MSTPCYREYLMLREYPIVSTPCYREHPKLL
jgi:hypothetical protein